MESGSASVMKVEYNHFHLIGEQVNKAIQDIAAETAELVMREAIVNMGPPGPPSPPGSPPANQTSELAQAFDVARPLKGSKKQARAYLWNDDEDSVHLEYGTVDIVPRPFVRPAVESNAGQFWSKLGNIEAMVRTR